MLKKFAYILSALALMALTFILTENGNAGPNNQEGQLTVTPASGPAGTIVVLEGARCNNPGQAAIIVFQGLGGEGIGTLGSAGIPNIPVDAQDRFRITFTIPSQLDVLQGEGGGPVVPGRYTFSSKPAGGCFAGFTVTPSIFPPSGGPLELQKDQRVSFIFGSYAWLLAVGVIGAVATAWFVYRRSVHRSPRP